MNIARLGIYLGIGALLHVLFVGSHFDWSSAWTWVWLFGWPIMLLVTFWIVVLGCVVLALVVVGAMAAMGKL